MSFADAVIRELNAASDNFLVSIADQTLISNGNFYPMVMVITSDALRVVVTHVGQLSERSMAHFWAAFFVRLVGGPFLAGAIGLALRYSAAVVYAELRQLAVSAIFDVLPQDLGVEDHATGALLIVRLLDLALGLLEDLLVIEILLARDVLAVTTNSCPRLGRGTSMALDVVEKAVARADPMLDAVHRAVKCDLAAAGSD